MTPRDLLTLPALQAVSAAAEVLYRRLLTTADDYGLHDARPAFILAACYPVRAREMGEDTITEALDELDAAGLIVRYTAGGQALLIIPGGQRRMQAPPRHPLPDGLSFERTAPKKYAMNITDASQAYLTIFPGKFTGKIVRSFPGKIVREKNIDEETRNALKKNEKQEEAAKDSELYQFSRGSSRGKSLDASKKEPPRKAPPSPPPLPLPHTPTLFSPPISPPKDTPRKNITETEPNDKATVPSREPEQHIIDILQRSEQAATRRDAPPATPPTRDEVLAYLRGAHCCLTATPAELETIAEQYLLDRESVGWVKQGCLIRNFRADAQAYAMRYRTNTFTAANRNRRPPYDPSAPRDFSLD